MNYQPCHSRKWRANLNRGIRLYYDPSIYVKHDNEWRIKSIFKSDFITYGVRKIWHEINRIKGCSIKFHRPISRFIGHTQFADLKYGWQGQINDEINIYYIGPEDGNEGHYPSEIFGQNDSAGIARVFQTSQDWWVAATSRTLTRTKNLAGVIFIKVDINNDLWTWGNQKIAHIHLHEFMHLFGFNHPAENEPQETVMNADYNTKTLTALDKESLAKWYSKQ